MYQYKIIEVPGATNIKNVKQLSVAQKDYEEKINLHSKDGWELDKIDSMITIESPGCIPSLFGAKPVERVHKILIYRKSI